MMKTILSYAISNTNYGIANLPNMYNFIICVMDNSTEEQNSYLLDSLILHLGREFYKGFREYVIKKLPNSKHLNMVNRIV